MTHRPAPIPQESTRPDDASADGATPADLDAIETGVEQLVRMALQAATSLEELVDCAEAAAALGTPELLELAAAQIAAEVDRALASSSAWEAELTYSKIDAWQQTGRKAHLLAEAFGLVAPPLRRLRA